MLSCTKQLNQMAYYYPDENGWAFYVDVNGESTYLVDENGELVQYSRIEISDTASSCSKKSESSKHSGSRRSQSSSDSGRSNNPATVGWQCAWCDEVNYTHHENIPFLDPLRDDDGNIRTDGDGNIMYPAYPNIRCTGCPKSCDPYARPLIDP